jgi:hypothetical protein
MLLRKSVVHLGGFLEEAHQMDVRLPKMFNWLMCLPIVPLLLSDTLMAGNLVFSTSVVYNSIFSSLLSVAKTSQSSDGEI